MNIIHTEKAPAVVGPYSQAIEVNGFIFCSGQIGVEPQSNNLKETLEEQSKQIFANIDTVLAQAGVTKKNIVKTVIFITNMGEYVKVNDLYATWLEDHRPARSTVEVSSLPKGALIEIEVVAVKE